MLSTKLVDLKAERAIQTGFSRDRDHREISQVGSERGGCGRRDDGRRSPGGHGRGGRWGRGSGGGRGGGRGGRGNDNARIVVNGVDAPDITKLKEFPKELNMILDHNVWITNSGSTTHSSTHKMGMTDIEPVPIQAGITQANGKSEKTECMGNIPITICN